MLAIPALLPDELYRSHVGRTIRINGMGTEPELTDHLAKSFEGSGRIGELAGLIELLSVATRVELRTLLCQHTLLPLWRGITWRFPEVPHADAASLGSRIDYGLRVIRANLQLCPDCVRADLDRFGMSYWHREHQYPGAFWCAKHRTPLKALGDWRAQLHSPSRYVDESFEMPASWCDEMLANASVQRFLRVIDGLMDTHKPFPAMAVTACLKYRAAQLGLLSATRTRSGSSSLLSDRVCESFPLSWLIEVLPEFGAKRQGEYMYLMDGVLEAKRHITQLTSYVLACCVLFDSADEALAELGVVCSDICLPRISASLSDQVAFS